MYGNFDAIKRRAKLRKETTSARQDNVRQRKGNLSSTGNEDDLFPTVDAATQASVIAEIQERFRLKRKKERLLYLYLFFFSAFILCFLAWKFIFPALF